MQVIRIEFGSLLYQQAVALRNERLRKPLGLDIHKDDLASEIDQLHFGIVHDETRLKACLVIKFLNAEEVQLRQMAVAEDFQRMGIGRQLVSEVESILQLSGVRKIILHSRKYAIGFYKALGYAEYGDEFTEVGIPHRMMEKYLDPGIRD